MLGVRTATALLTSARADVGQNFSAALTGGTGTDLGIEDEINLHNVPDERADFTLRLG